MLSKCFLEVENMLFGRHAKHAQNNQKKGNEQNYDFLHEDKYQSFIQVDTIVSMIIGRHARSAQNNNFAISLQHPKKKVRNEDNFLHAGERQSFP